MKKQRNSFLRSALIGYTGFVGSNLKSGLRFDAFYNSKNIKDINGKKYNIIICAGAYGTKWKANKEPDSDRTSIICLMENLKNVQTDKFVLISTIDVYINPFNVNENTPLEQGKSHPYREHRKMLEEFVVSHFNSVIVRLPGLFGKGLRKNIIYDFINNERINEINPKGTFQFYNLDRLYEDVQKVIQEEIKLINIATEPISVQEIAKEVFNIELPDSIVELYPNYDVHTIYAPKWNRLGNYLSTKMEILEELKKFVAEGKR